MVELAFIGQNEYFNCCYPSKMEGYNISKYHLDIHSQEQLKKIKADYIFIFRPDFISTDVLKSIQGKKVWISTEPIERQDVIPSMLNVMNSGVEWHDIYHYDKTHLADLNKISVQKIKEFELPVNLEIFNLWHVVEQPKEFDLFFAGRSTVHRELLMSRLKRDYRFAHTAHGFTDSWFKLILKSSKICLNLNINDFAQRQHRLQNMLACGAFVLSEKQTHQSSLKAGEHYIEFSGEKDLYNKVEFYLSNEDAMTHIQEQGYFYTIENFNANKCWLNLIKTL